MQVWTEPGRGQCIALNVLLAILCGAIGVFPFFWFIATGNVIPPYTTFAFVLWLAISVSFGIALLTRGIDSRVIYSFEWPNELLAVLYKSTGLVHRAGFRKVRLLPWPFYTDYKVASYPTSFSFSCPLQPMTRNPKLVPLMAMVKMELPPNHGREPWFSDYLKDPAASDKAFRRHAFDALQHSLPQELAERLNPYDDSSQAEFQRFVQNAFLSFEVYLFGKRSSDSEPIKTRLSVHSTDRN